MSSSNGRKMKTNEENNNNKKRKPKKKDQSYFDEDKFYQNKLNKEFKYRKKYLVEDEDDDWQEWEQYK